MQIAEGNTSYERKRKTKALQWFTIEKINSQLITFWNIFIQISFILRLSKLKLWVSVRLFENNKKKLFNKTCTMYVEKILIWCFTLNPPLSREHFEYKRSRGLNIFSFIKLFVVVEGQCRGTRDNTSARSAQRRSWARWSTSVWRFLLSPLRAVPLSWPQQEATFPCVALSGERLTRHLFHGNHRLLH